MIAYGIIMQLENSTLVQYTPRYLLWEHWEQTRIILKKEKKIIFLNAHRCILYFGNLYFLYAGAEWPTICLL